MKVFPMTKPLSPCALSIIPKPLAQQSSPQPLTRIFMQSKPNSPMLLVISSDYPKFCKTFSFTAGEKIKHRLEKTSLKEPQISKFELSDGPQSLVNEVKELTKALVQDSTIKAEALDASRIEDKENSCAIPLERTSVEKQCRICFENDQEEDFISPCLCKGFQEYVHSGCLKMWLLRSEKSEKELTFCEVCRGKFKMSFEYSTGLELCSPRSFKFWIPFALFWVCMSAILIFGFGEKMFSGVNFESKVFVYTFLGMICCFSFGVMAFNAKNICLEKQIVDWEILNY